MTVHEIKQDLEDLAKKAQEARNPIGYHLRAYELIYRNSEFDCQSLLRHYYAQYQFYKNDREHLK